MARKFTNKNFTNKSYINPVTQDYIQKFITAGLAIPSNIHEVDCFVKELSLIISPSLWIAWALSNVHNTDSGNIIYSFGNLNNCPGTLVNNPTRDATGITFVSASAQKITILNPMKSPAMTSFSMLSVFDSTLATNKGVWGSLGGAGSRGPQLFAGGSPLQGPVATDLFVDNTEDGTAPIGLFDGISNRYIGGNTGTWQTVNCGFSGTEEYLEYDNATRNAVPVNKTVCWNNNALWNIGGRITDTFYFDGTINLCIFFFTSLDRATYINIKEIIKRTIGKQLNLP